MNTFFRSVAFLLLSTSFTSAQSFVTTWKTNNIGSSNIDQITIPAEGIYDIYWEEVGNSNNNGTISNVTDSYTLTFPSVGTYRISLSGDLERIHFSTNGDPLKLLDIEQWGSTNWTSMKEAFVDCQNMTCTASDEPDLSNVTDMSRMFSGCYSLNSDFSSWNTSNIELMDSTFWRAIIFDQDISTWDVSSVTDMTGMFNSASNFNQDISSWDLSACTNLSGMFNNAKRFNVDISSWNISNVTEMQDFLDDSGMSPDNYEELLIAWSNLPLYSNVNFGSKGRTYCSTSAQNARAILTNIYNWNINGDLEMCIDDPENYIAIWKTDNSNFNSLENEAIMHIEPNGIYYGIWEEVGDPNNSGSFSTSVDAYVITFPHSGTYKVSVRGNLGKLKSETSRDPRNLVSVENWGDETWSELDHAFQYTGTLTINATDAIDLSGVTNLTNLFLFVDTLSGELSHWDLVGVQNLTGVFYGLDHMDVSIKDWDVSTVTDMSNLFRSNKDFNEDISSWDVSSVTHMVYMFASTGIFNQDISSWDVSSVIRMTGMFFNADNFNQDISNWDVSLVVFMDQMFANNSGFNQDLSAWDVTSVTNMNRMFSGADAFNQDLSAWDVSSVISMNHMFIGADAFNQSLNDWDVSAVVDMSYMFWGTSKFNQDLSAWDVSSVTNMEGMFENSDAFDQDLSDWDVSGVTSFKDMFKNACNFDQDLGDWDISNSYSAGDNGMFDFSGLSEINLGKTLNGWSTLTPNSALRIGAEDIEYCGIQAIISNFNEIHGYVSGPQRNCDYTTVSIWKTDNPGTSGPNEIDLPLSGNYDVFWIDESNPSIYGHLTGLIDSQRIVLAYPDTFAIYVTGDLTKIQFKDRADKEKILSFNHWGNHEWTSLSQAFQGCTNMTYAADDRPTLYSVNDLNSTFESVKDFAVDVDYWNLGSVKELNFTFKNASTFNSPLRYWYVYNVTSMIGTFDGATSFNQDISSWDVDKVANMTAMFKGATAYNGDMTYWDTDNCEVFNFMFSGATSFNQDINYWDMDLAQSVNYMFAGASSFNQPLDTWDVGNVTSMIGMFSGAANFNQDISSWDVANVTSFREMFRNASAFNQDISDWNVSSSITLKSMFENANSFDQDISSWDISSCLNLVRIFRGADSFNHDLNSWDVSNVTNMQEAFENATSFNQALDSWDVSNVHTMRDMFRIATSFDQSLDSWDISNASDMVGMLSNSGLSIEHYDETLLAWSNLPTTVNDTLGAHTLIYCDSDDAREDLLNDHGWVIVGDNKNCPFDSLITIWRTDNPGISNDDEITIPAVGMYNVYWEDVENSSINGILNNQTGSLNIIFPAAGLYRVYFSGDLERIHFNNGGDKNKIVSIEQWGEIAWTNMEGAFYGCSNLQINASDAPDLTDVISSKFMFRECSSMNANIAHWDMSTISDFSSMLKKATSFNQNLGGWDISSAILMNGILDDAGMNVANYDSTLIEWANTPPYNVNIGAKNQEYCLSESARDELINTYGWTFNNDNLNCCLVWDGEGENEDWHYPLNWDQNYTPTIKNSVKILDNSDQVTISQNAEVLDLFNSGILTILNGISFDIHGQ